MATISSSSSLVAEPIRVAKSGLIAAATLDVVGLSAGSIAGTSIFFNGVLRYSASTTSENIIDPNPKI